MSEKARALLQDIHMVLISAPRRRRDRGWAHACLHSPRLRLHGQAILCPMDEPDSSDARPLTGSLISQDASSSSPRRPRLTSSKDRTHSSPSGSRSPRPRNAIPEYYETQTFAYGNEGSSGSYSSNANPSSGSSGGPQRSESDRGPYMHTSSTGNLSEGQGDRDATAQHSQAGESDFPSLSAVSNIPGMSGIGLATNPLPSSYPKGPSLGAGLYSSSPPITFGHSVGPSAASHLAKVSTGAATSSTTTTSAAGHRSRSRLTNRNSEGGSGDFRYDTSGSGSSRRRQNSQERPKTGVSSGTSNSNSSTWSFFRTASSTHLAPRAQLSDPFAAIAERAEPMLSPITGRSGVSTPLGYDTGQTTPVMHPSGLNEELRRRIAGLRNENRSRSRGRVNYSCTYVVSEGSPNQASPPTGSFLHAAKRRGRKGSVSSFSYIENQPKRRAEGLVAMAAREANTSESAKVVIAGRSCEAPKVQITER